MRSSSLWEIKDGAADCIGRTAYGIDGKNSKRRTPHFVENQ
jgi:hypothetical protein